MVHQPSRCMYIDRRGGRIPDLHAYGLGLRGSTRAWPPPGSEVAARANHPHTWYTINMMDRTHTPSPRFPAAEALARRMEVPLTTCPVTRELYGYAAPILDAPRAARFLASAGHLVGTPAHAVAMAILEERAQSVADQWERWGR